MAQMPGGTGKNTVNPNKYAGKQAELKKLGQEPGTKYGQNPSVKKG